MLVSGFPLAFTASDEQEGVRRENEWRQRREIGGIKGRRWKREQRDFAQCLSKDDGTIAFTQCVNI